MPPSCGWQRCDGACWGQWVVPHSLPPCDFDCVENNSWIDLMSYNNYIWYTTMRVNKWHTWIIKIIKETLGNHNYGELIKIGASSEIVWWASLRRHRRADSNASRQLSITLLLTQEDTLSYACQKKVSLQFTYSHICVQSNPLSLTPPLPQFYI